jgi:hypothetical protein
MQESEGLLLSSMYVFDRGRLQLTSRVYLCSANDLSAMIYMCVGSLLSFLQLHCCAVQSRHRSYGGTAHKRRSSTHDIKLSCCLLLSTSFGKEQAVNIVTRLFGHRRYPLCHVHLGYPRCSAGRVIAIDSKVCPPSRVVPPGPAARSGTVPGKATVVNGQPTLVTFVRSLV